MSLYSVLLVNVQRLSLSVSEQIFKLLSLNAAMPKAIKIFCLFLDFFNLLPLYL